jgi:hypothetical protein
MFRGRTSGGLWCTECGRRRAGPVPRGGGGRNRTLVERGPWRLYQSKRLIIEVEEAMCYIEWPDKKGGSNMASNSKKTEMRRKRKRGGQGKKRKALMSKMSTPAFAVHPEKGE